MFSSLTRIILILGIPIVIAAGLFLYLQHAVFSPADSSNNEVKLFQIARGTGFRKVCEDLEKEGLIGNARGMHILARLRGLDKTIDFGEYQLSASMTPQEILNKFVSGDVYERAITIKEGMNIWDIGQIVQDSGLMSKEEFDKGVVSPVLLARAGLAAASFEGYLFPDTYKFSRPVTPKDIIFHMLKHGETKWPPEYTEAADALRMSRHDILTLASIIEKESGNVEEQPIVSSVFHNRLKKGIKLQADPTVVYGIENFTPPITKEHLETNHPYNTYVHYGLPSGPICNPGQSAIQAALFPEDTNYLFFVADGKGGHVFSATLKEHNAAVARYRKVQRKKKAEEGK